jgi:hypothetical protein
MPRELAARKLIRRPGDCSFSSDESSTHAAMMEKTTGNPRFFIPFIHSFDYIFLHSFPVQHV